MHKFNKKETADYAPKQLYELAIDVDKYCEFLPWCAASRVISHTEELMRAELTIGFKGFRESYISRIVSGGPDDNGVYRIETTLENGPFAKMDGLWIFTPVNGGCSVEFSVEFKMKSALLDKVVGPVFSIACEKMASAFVARAHEVYGKYTDRT